MRFYCRLDCAGLLRFSREMTFGGLKEERGTLHCCSGRALGRAGWLSKKGVWQAQYGQRDHVSGLSPSGHGGLSCCLLWMLARPIQMLSRATSRLGIAAIAPCHPLSHQDCMASAARDKRGNLVALGSYLRLPRDRNGMTDPVCEYV